MKKLISYSKKKKKLRHEQPFKKQKVAHNDTPRLSDAAVLGQLYVKQLDLEQAINRLHDNSRHITSDISKQIVDTLQSAGFHCIRAKSEADFLLSLLSETKKCDYVAAEDGDILLSGAENVVRNFISVLLDGSLEVPTFNRSDILKSLGLTSHQFLQLGCLMNCDYQPGIKNVGALKGWKIIKQYGNIKDFLHSPMFIKSKMQLPPNQSVENFCITMDRTIEIFKWRPDKVDTGI